MKCLFFTQLVIGYSPQNIQNGLGTQEHRAFLTLYSSLLFMYSIQFFNLSLLFSSQLNSRQPLVKVLGQIYSCNFFSIYKHQRVKEQHAQQKGWIDKYWVVLEHSCSKTKGNIVVSICTGTMGNIADELICLKIKCELVVKLCIANKLGFYL